MRIIFLHIGNEEKKRHVKIYRLHTKVSLIILTGCLTVNFTLLDPSHFYIPLKI